MSSEVPIGRLRRRVRLEAAIATPTDAGTATITWTPVASLWADIAPLSGTETVVADRRQGRVTHRVTMRYRADVTAAHRLVFGTRVLEIRSVLSPEEGRRHLVCICEETTP